MIANPSDLPGGRLAKLEILIPSAAWEKMRSAAALGFDLPPAQTTDPHVFRWLWLELGVSVFGEAVNGSDQLTDLGVLCYGWSDCTPSHIDGAVGKPLDPSPPEGA